MSLLVEPISVKTAPFFKYGGRAQKDNVAVRKRLSVERMTVLHLFLTVAVIYNALVPRLPQRVFRRVVGGNPRPRPVEADGFRNRAADQAESYEAEMKPVEICHAVSPMPWAKPGITGLFYHLTRRCARRFLAYRRVFSLRHAGPVNTAFIDIAIDGFYYEEHTRLL